MTPHPWSHESERKEDVMRVLVGLDGSPSSRAALRWAAALVLAEGGDLVAATVRVPPFAEVWPETIEERRGVEAELLDQWCAPLRDSGVLFRQVLVEGDPREELLELAFGHRADVVVVGARGSGGRRHALHLGSTTHHLIHHTSVPLVAVPASASASWPAPVVIGVDGSLGSDRAVEWLAKNGGALTDDIIAVHGEKPLAQFVPLDDPRSWYQLDLDRMQGWVAPLRDCGLGARTLVIDGDPVDAMTDAAIAEGAGMIVVGARGSGGVRGLRLGATALKVLHQAELPVLMVPADM
jgi:nucleotide-binding universal stress UspA family protein